MFRKMLAAAVLVAAPTAFGADDWSYGFGTGFFGLNTDGDTSFGTTGGTVDLDNDLSTSDTSTLMESGFGGGGYATNGTWTILASYGKLELQGGLEGQGIGVPGGPRVKANWERTLGEGAVVYNFYREGRHVVGALGGFRYYEHDYEFTVKNVNPVVRRDVNEDWTDAIVGLTYAYGINEDWAWTNRANYGFGGSEGSYLVNSGLRWQALDWLAATFYAQYESIDFEENDRADADYYSYDVDEYGLGISLMVTW